MDKETLKKFRSCIRCLYKGNSNDPNFQKYRGVFLHILGDTYGHLKFKYHYGPDGEVVGYEEEGDGTFSSPLGHYYEVNRPDTAALRPELAKTFLTDVFYLAGGTNEIHLMKILEVVDKLPNTMMGKNKNAYMKFLDHINDKNYFNGMDSVKMQYDPRKMDNIKGQTIEPDEMKKIIDMVKNICLKPLGY